MCFVYNVFKFNKCNSLYNLVVENSAGLLKINLSNEFKVTSRFWKWVWYVLPQNEILYEIIDWINARYVNFFDLAFIINLRDLYMQKNLRNVLFI